MNIAVTGATGLVGSELVSRLENSDHHVRRIVRNEPHEDDILWSPSAGEIDKSTLEGVDAVVHLAGESIADGRWNEDKKARIRDSRVEGTRFLCKTLAELSTPPKTLISGSAVGYYGDRGEHLCDEQSEPGNGFLADVCLQWESATEAASHAGIRVVNLRIGVVLSPRGGALAKMLLPFKLGAGGVIGNGRQYWSWISLEDLAGAIIHCLHQEALRGPVNAVAPHPVTNYEFTKTLGRVLSRPTMIPMPAFAARIALGEMADALLLASTRAHPKRLVETNFPFQHASLESALRHLSAR